MTTISRQEIAAQYENYSIYVILSSRGALPGFHWGIFVPTDTPTGNVWHATDREGGWKLEEKPSSNVPFSMSLVLASKIGSVNQSTWPTCRDVLDSVPVDGKPSPSTGEPFSCRVWVKDAITALCNNGIIVLGGTLAELETRLVRRANTYKLRVETGKSAAQVDGSSS